MVSLYDLSLDRDRDGRAGIRRRIRYRAATEAIAVSRYWEERSVSEHSVLAELSQVPVCGLVTDA